MKKELEMFNICNLGIHREKNIISIEKNVMIEMFKDEERYEYFKNWLYFLIAEMSNDKNNVNIELNDKNIIKL